MDAPTGREMVQFRAGECEYFNELVTVDEDGSSDHTQLSHAISISADGNVVAFISEVALVEDAKHDTRTDKLVFVRDLSRGVTELVSRNARGERVGERVEPNYPHISGDGRHVVYTDRADDLVEVDTNGTEDIFVRHLGPEPYNEMVTLTVDGRQLAVPLSPPAVGFDAKWVAFASNGRWATPDDGQSDLHEHRQVFVRDLDADTTLLASRRADGQLAQGDTEVDALVGTSDRPLLLLSTKDPDFDGNGSAVGGAMLRDLSLPSHVGIERVSFDEDFEPVDPIQTTISASGDHVYYVTGAGVFHHDRRAGDVRKLLVDDCITPRCRISTNAHYLPDGRIGAGDGEFLLVFRRDDAILLDVDRNVAINPMRHPDGTPMGIARHPALAGNATRVAWATMADGGGETPDMNDTIDHYVRRLFPEWGPTGAYRRGDLVSHRDDSPGVPQTFPPSRGVPRLDGQHFRARLAHDSQNNWSPARATSLWERIEECGAAAIADAWEAGLSYLVGERVAHEGSDYECVQSHTAQVGWEPPWTPALWRAL